MILRYLLVLALVIWSQAPRAGERDAVVGQLADVATTGTGLALGAAEANPFGLLLLGAKLAAHQHIKAQPAPDQPRLWGVFGAFGWGAAASNVCTLVTGGACWLVGVAAGWITWMAHEPERMRAQFDALCEQERQRVPDLQCVWTGS